MLRLIVVIALLLIATLFAVQNASVLTVEFLTWKTEASLAMVVAVCFALGAMATALALVPRMYRRWTEIRALRARLTRLEAEVESRRPAPEARSEVSP